MVDFSAVGLNLGVKLCEGFTVFKVVCKNGNFWSSEFQEVPFGSPFSFNFSGPTAGGVTLLDPNTIFVRTGGDYLVTYTVSVNTNIIANALPIPPAPGSIYAPVVNVSINGALVPNAQIAFGIQIQYNPGINNNSCFQIHGEAILRLPDNARVQLVNDSFFSGEASVVNIIETCDNGVNAAAINLVKLSPDGNMG